MRGEAAEPDCAPTDDPIDPLPQSRLLIDSDSFVLFAATGLLDRVVTCLGFTLDDARRLDALPHMLRRGKRFRDLTEAERAAALGACERVLPLRERPSTKTLQNLTGVAGIDAADAVLLASAHGHSGTVLLTGDKRALSALPRVPTVCAGLSGRVVCIEQVLVHLVITDGVAAVYALFAERAKHHSTLKVCFSQVNRASQGECLRVLQQVYIAELEALLPTGWLRAVQTTEPLAQGGEGS